MGHINRDPHRGFADDVLGANYAPNPSGPLVPLNERLVLSQRPQNISNQVSLEGAMMTSMPFGADGVSERTLAKSWLLIIVTAPLLVVLLLWLLILIERRLKITRSHLVNQNSPQLSQNSSRREGCHCVGFESTTGGHKKPYKQTNASRTHDKQKRPSHNSNSSKNNREYLLQPNTSDSSTATSSSSSDSTSRAPFKPSLMDVAEQPSTGCLCPLSTLVGPSDTSGQSADSMLSLVDHMGAYLVTLTYQEIAACLIAFFIAILNIVRMRNLFCCNLVIFVLITSKLLNLLTLTTFSVTKLIKVIKVKPASTPPHQSQPSPASLSSDSSSSNRGYQSSTSPVSSGSSETLKLSGKQKKVSLAPTIVRRRREGSRLAEDENEGALGNEAQQVELAASDKRLPSDEEGDVNQLVDRQRGRNASPTFDTNATICRLIAKDHNLSGDSKVAAKGSCSADRYREPIALRLLTLSLVSALLALVCLYLKLMPRGGPFVGVIPGQRNVNKSAADWSIAIYNPSTSTTEASTRYTSEESPVADQPTLQISLPSSPRDANYGHASGWASKFQQSSQLAHLIDQYELQTFANLLFDTHIQTSRFACTLSLQNYGHSGKLAMLGLYATLMLLILLLSLSIRQVGRQRLRQFEALQLSGLPDSLAHHLKQNHFKPKYQQMEHTISVSTSDSNRKRYSELLKQSMRHHQSSLDLLNSIQNSRRHQNHQRARAANGRLRASSSMSSLLVANPSALTAERCKLQSSFSAGRRKSRSKWPTNAHSMSNLAHNRSIVSPLQATTNSKQSNPSKLGYSRGQLAWLPLGSAATVASLNNISLVGGPQERNGPRTARSRCSWQQQLPVGSSNDASGGSLDERDELRDMNSSILHEASGQLQPTCLMDLNLRWPLYLNQTSVNNKNRSNYVELKRDLRLTQSLILFGQLLNHAPILLLLALANLLPDGILGGWNSSHDNGFVWLTLIEGLALPLLLCTADSRLASAFRRSLHSSSPPAKRTGNRGPSSATTGTGTTTTTTANVAHSQLAKYLAGQQCQSRPLVLGASASYPDFMFVCPTGSNPIELARQKSLASFNSLTGPPYQPGKQRALQPAISTISEEDSIGLNFALMGELKHEPYPLVGTEDLMASRRARYRQLPVSTKRVSRKRRTLVSVTKRLFRLGSGRAREVRQRRRRQPTSGTLTSTVLDGGSTGSHYNKQQGDSANGERAGGNSPTSSLSTLIRKFNHDNYTSVCQLYSEQRKQQLPTERKEEVLIDGLDSDNSVGLAPTTDVEPAPPAKLLAEAAILCRKGGLYYNYSLDKDNKSPVQAPSPRVNPMQLAGRQLKQSIVDGPEVVGGGSGGAPKKSSSELLELFGGLEQAGRLFEPCGELKQSYKSGKNKDIGGELGVCLNKKKRKEGENEEKEEEEETLDSNSSNNETIISNITSVQELLDKMNGMMAAAADGNGSGSRSVGDFDEMQQAKEANHSLEVVVVPGGGSKRKKVAGGKRSMVKNGSANKSILEMMTGNSFSKNNTKQPNPATGEQAAPSKQSNHQPQRHPGDNNQTTFPFLQSNFDSLRSLDDALSMVSVGSEFEYHNINGNQQRQLDAIRVQSRQPVAIEVKTLSEEQPTAIGGAKQHTTNDQASQREVSVSGNTMVERLIDKQNPSSGSSIDSATRQRLEQIRFPSFLPSSSKQPGGILAAAGQPHLPVGEESRFRSSARMQPAPSSRSNERALPTASKPSPLPAGTSNNGRAAGNLPTSSSLLNLTSAKFANALNGNNNFNGQRSSQVQRQLAVSSNTITKQKANNRLVTLSEFGAIPTRDQKQQQQQHARDDESSLPTESGNVRARIRKMELQSTPELNNLSSQQSASGHRRGSMIPVTANGQASSRLPVLTSNFNAPSSSGAAGSSNYLAKPASNHYQKLSPQAKQKQQQQQTSAAFRRSQTHLTRPRY